MASVEIDVEDYLDEVSTNSLLDEIRRRRRNKRYFADDDGSIISADEIREWAHRIELGQAQEVAREMFVVAFQRGAPVDIDRDKLPAFLRLAAP